jgi:SAM-dependent methyltransferase
MEDSAALRHEREREFHNQAYSDDRRQALWSIYDLAEASWDWLRDAAAGAGAARPRVLELGCGNEAQAWHLAKMGAEVVGIDISDVAVDQAKEKAVAEGVSDRTEFLRMDAEAPDFPAESFDVVCGASILHHLDLGTAYAGIARVMRPDGQAVFLEPLGHNPVINAFRNRTPEMRTEDEHPLLEPDLRLAGDYFGDVKARFFHLATLAAIPLRGRPGFDAARRALDAADRVLFRAVPPARRHAWIVGLRLSRPRAASGV